MKRISVFVLIALIGLSVSSSLAQTDSLLMNGDFEQGFSAREAPEVVVANGWDYSYQQGDSWECESPCSRPEFKPEEQIAVSGFSQRWFTTFSRQFAAIHQVVDVESGQWYEFSCYAYAISEPDGQQAAFVGANPWSGGVFEREMVWGQQQPWGSYRKWNRVSVTFQAFGNRVRVAAGSNNNWPTKNNAAYWDNCEMRQVDIGTQPTSEPTCTPQPTPEPCPTCSPGDCDLDAIRSAIETVVAEREPVVWPRRD